MQYSHNKFVNKGSDKDVVKSLLDGIDYSDVACAAVSFTNDMKHIHLHAVGEDFDKIHDLAGQYYDTASEDSDYLAELTIEMGGNMPNFSLATSIIQWRPEMKIEYNYYEALESIATKLSLYIDLLLRIRQSPGVPDNVTSWLDDKTREWMKELEYKVKKRMASDVL